MEDLLRVAEEVGAHVTWRNLGRRRGEYRAAPAIITINPRMSTVLQRSTLAHELGHHHYRDAWTDDVDVLRARELRANAYAARLLITPHAYAAAEAIAGPHPGALARELGVARYVVEAWQTAQARTPRRIA